MMFGTHIIEKLLPTEKPSNESSKELFTLENHGSIENGIANLNLLYSVTLKEAFKKVLKMMKGKARCKLFSDLSIVLMKICPKEENVTEAVGSFSSTIRVSFNITSTCVCLYNGLFCLFIRLFVLCVSRGMFILSSALLFVNFQVFFSLSSPFSL